MTTRTPAYNWAPSTDSMSSEVLGAIDAAVMVADPADTLTVYLPENGRGYSIVGESMRLSAYMNDNVLHVYTATRNGVMTGREVAITHPTHEVVLAVVVAMLAEVTA